MKDRIQRWASLLIGTAVVIVVGWLTYDRMSRPAQPGGRTVVGAVDAAAGRSVPGDATTAATTDALDSSVERGPPPSLLGDGDVLPASAPQTMKIGVVLVQFAGAESAPTTARARPEALKLALELAALARTDWKAAVKAGDPGSADDIGTIPRGVLGHATEVSVFSLSGAGQISDPMETPRGYWIVKRLE